MLARVELSSFGGGVQVATKQSLVAFGWERGCPEGTLSVGCSSSASLFCTQQLPLAKPRPGRVRLFRVKRKQSALSGAQPTLLVGAQAAL